MNPKDIINFLAPNFSDLLQATFFMVMISMLLFTMVCVHLLVNKKAWEKNWNRESNGANPNALDIKHGSVTDLWQVTATWPEKLAEVMPGLLLVIGLLGTFLGLGLALDKASSILGSSGAMEASGTADSIQNMMGMLKGLGTKFKTSTWGISGFIILKFWSEITRFEEKRLSWVISKAKTATDNHNKLIEDSKKEKFQQQKQIATLVASHISKQIVNAIGTNSDKIIHHNKESFDNHGSHISNLLQTHSTRHQKNMESLVQELKQSTYVINASLLTLEEKASIRSADAIHTVNEGFSKASTEIQSYHTRHQQDMEILIQELKQSTVTINTSLLSLEDKASIHSTNAIQAINDGLCKATTEIQRMSEASQKTNDAMELFTTSTQTVVKNMDSAAERMASGAHGIGEASSNLVSAVQTFESSFTKVLDNIRTDLGSAITNMSDQASQTLEIGSRQLSEATQQISKSMEQLSGDVRQTMNNVKDSIETGLKIQKNASEQFAVISETLSNNIEQTTNTVEAMATPIKNGLKAISETNMKFSPIIQKNIEISEKLSSIAEKFQAIEDLASSNHVISQKLQELIQSLDLGKDETNDTIRQGIKEQNGQIAKVFQDVNQAMANRLQELIRSLDTGKTEMNSAISQSMKDQSSQMAKVLQDSNQTTISQFQALITSLDSVKNTVNLALHQSMKIQDSQTPKLLQDESPEINPTLP